MLWQIGLYRDFLGGWGGEVEAFYISRFLLFKMNIGYEFNPICNQIPHQLHLKKISSIDI